MSPLSDKAPRSDKVLYVFYDFETTQDTKWGDASYEHVPNLVCMQQFCAVCEDDPDMDVDCRRCGKGKHSFWTDPVGDLISYTFKFSRSSHYPPRLRRCTSPARERTSAMHGAATHGPVSPGAAIQVQRPPIILFM